MTDLNETAAKLEALLATVNMPVIEKKDGIGYSRLYQSPEEPHFVTGDLLAETYSDGDGFIIAAINALPSFLAERKVLREALVAAQTRLAKSADQFAFYADEHAKKNTPDGADQGNPARDGEYDRRRNSPILGAIEMTNPSSAADAVERARALLKSLDKEVAFQMILAALRATPPAPAVPATPDTAALVEAFQGLLTWAETIEDKSLVGDEGCLWPVENARHALATFRVQSTPAPSEVEASAGEREAGHQKLRDALIAEGRKAGCALADDVSDDFLTLVPAEIAALALRSTPNASSANEGLATINRIADLAAEIGSQAGVGGMETAGAIVSFLAAHPEHAEAVLSGAAGPIDWPAAWLTDGKLTWQTKDGRIMSREKRAEIIAHRKETGK